MNESKASYYKQTENGYSVFFDGVEVAYELTWQQAAGLLDDLSYYGRPIRCIYNREKDCMWQKALCIACMERKNMEAEKDG